MYCVHKLCTKLHETRHKRFFPAWICVQVYKQQMASIIISCKIKWLHGIDSTFKTKTKSHQSGGLVTNYFFNRIKNGKLTIYLVLCNYQTTNIYIHIYMYNLYKHCIICTWNYDLACLAIWYTLLVVSLYTINTYYTN